MYVVYCRSLSEWCGHYGAGVRPLWCGGAAVMVRGCGRYGAATMVCTIRCGDSMVLVFYGARQNGAMVFFALWNFWWPLLGRFFKLSVSNATN